ncbi:SHOCT domain-containing protein [Streptomyces sp. NPDC004838]
MNTPAFGDGQGPGPWIPLAPLIWALVLIGVFGVVTVLRRTGPWRGHRDPRRTRTHTGRTALDPYGEKSPIALLGRRFALGEIDEDEYWRRLSVLDERFGRADREVRG